MHVVTDQIMINSDRPNSDSEANCDIFDLFNNAVSNSDYTESNGRMISESEGMKKKAVVE
jgi:hypothetical protein